MLWLVGATLYTGTPTVVLMPAMRRWRKRACQEALPSPDASPAEIAFDDVQRIDEMYRFVSRVSVLPIRYNVQAAIAYLVPLALAVYQTYLALQE